MGARLRHQVTPSSKVVGDLAQFMVSNGITDEHQLLERSDQLSFPASVIEFFQVGSSLRIYHELIGGEQ